MVTNDFPPRVGGVQQYVWNLIRHMPQDRVAVLAPRWPGWREHDAAQPYPVGRWPATFLWPTPDLARRVRAMARQHQADVILFGHGMPLPLLGEQLEGIPYVALTHGAEVWMAHAPGAARLVRRALRGARGITAVSGYTARTIRRVVGPNTPVSVLSPGVDADRFTPAVEGGWVRERHALGSRPTVLCVSRLVPRKGQDILIRSLPQIRDLVPEATLLLTGTGPHRATLERLADGAPPGSVVFAGEVSDADLPAYYAASDVFAMPCRSRWGGLEVEGFGIVFLEAAAAGKAVVGGHSGGAGEAVVDELTGLLVDGAEPKAVALACAKLLRFPDLAASFGSAGRSRVETEFTWPRRAAALMAILRSAAG